MSLLAFSSTPTFLSYHDLQETDPTFSVLKEKVTYFHFAV